uniref:PHP domain-containing protein n=1 Tax=Magnetococcus massalia (strain MO-1) TaxID=451514 RepID=A0A1S7LI94_MAGMO|nr:protein of unknown function [Candidatus Magnetococcus massalia]
MVYFDLHYHLNTKQCRPIPRQRRLNEHLRTFRTASKGLDAPLFIASTEHAFKRPLEAYETLSQLATEVPNLTILPGIEAISRERVELIFLFPSRRALQHALPHLGPFEWSLGEAERLRRELGAIVIIPHPYNAGRTGIINHSWHAYSDACHQSDYVEVCNGSGLFMSESLVERKHRKHISSASKLSQRYRMMQKMANLPPEARPGTPQFLPQSTIGYAIGSDAHFGGQLQVIGKSYDKVAKGEWFEYLQQQVRFEKRCLRSMMDRSRLEDMGDVIRGSHCVMQEATYKGSLLLRRKRSVWGRLASAGFQFAQQFHRG